MHTYITINGTSYKQNKQTKNRLAHHDGRGGGLPAGSC